MVKGASCRMVLGYPKPCRSICRGSCWSTGTRPVPRAGPPVRRTCTMPRTFSPGADVAPGAAVVLRRGEHSEPPMPSRRSRLLEGVGGAGAAVSEERRETSGGALGEGGKRRRTSSLRRAVASKRVAQSVARMPNDRAGPEPASWRPATCPGLSLWRSGQGPRSRHGFANERAAGEASRPATGGAARSRASGGAPGVLRSGFQRRAAAPGPCNGPRPGRGCRGGPVESP